MELEEERIDQRLELGTPVLLQRASSRWRGPNGEGCVYRGVLSGHWTRGRSKIGRNNDAVLQLWECWAPSTTTSRGTGNPVPTPNEGRYGLVAWHSSKCASTDHWSMESGARLEIFTTLRRIPEELPPLAGLRERSSGRQLVPAWPTTSCPFPPSILDKL